MPARPHQTDAPKAWVSITLLAVALALSVLAVLLAYTVYARLPYAQYREMSGRWTAASQAALARGPRVAQAWNAVVASNAIARTWRGKREIDRIERDVASTAHAGPSGQLPRLQQAAAHMLVLEASGQSIDTWWPSLANYLSGLEHGDFSHELRPCLDALNEAYVAAGMDPGVAATSAQIHLGGSHSMFLQYIVPRLTQLAADRESAGDAAAAQTCRTIAMRLLDQWVLEPGPADLRLLAADLLARTLESAAAQTPETQQLATDLRAWRAAFRDAAAQRPHIELSIASGASPCPTEQTRFINRFVAVGWLASATLMTGVIALILSWSLFREGRMGARPGRCVLGGVIVSLIAAAAGLAWIASSPDSVIFELRCDFSSLRYWPRSPLYAAAIAGVLVLLAAAIRRKTANANGFTCVASIALTSWIFLALFTSAEALLAERARAALETATAAALHDDYAAIAGPAADPRLEALRRWTP